MIEIVWLSAGKGKYFIQYKIGLKQMLLTIHIASANLVNEQN